MRVAVDISLYPLQEDLIPPIRDVIERIKQDLPVWKKEFHPDGSHTWAQCHHPGDPESAAGGEGASS